MRQVTNRSQLTPCLWYWNKRAYFYNWPVVKWMVKTGPIQTFTPITSFFGTVKKGTRIQITAKEGYWTLLYLVKGNINIDMESAEKYQLVVFEKENEDIIICAEEDSTLLFLSAEPIEEPIAAKDNFVMNSMEEIEEAMADAAAGKFGRLTY